MPHRPFKYFTYGLLVLSLSGCGMFHPGHYEMAGDVSSLAGLTRVHAIPKYMPADQSSHLRLRSIRDYAFSVSAQIACAQQINRLEHLLDELNPVLDRVYSLNTWMLPHNVLPPVLVQAQQSIRLVDEQTMRIAGHTYRIEQDAKFVSYPPHWRYDFLLKDTAHLTNNLPQSLVVDLLPKNKKEQSIWQEAVKEGWQAGIQQARHNFLANLNTLERTLNGMILYRQLLARGMISAPYVSHTNLGVTGDDRTIHTHDQILRITALPTLQHVTDEWIPVITAEEEK